MHHKSAHPPPPHFVHIHAILTRAALHIQHHHAIGACVTRQQNPLSVSRAQNDDDDDDHTHGLGEVVE